MKKIFISRELSSDSIFKKELENQGFHVYGESLLQFELIPFGKIPEVDWLFFYSQKGVQFFFNHILDNNISLPVNIKLAGFGEKTAAMIESYQVECHFVGTGKAKSTALEFLKIAAEQTILFPRAKNSQRSVQQLIDNQTITKDLIIYKNSPKAAFDFPKMDFLVFTSPLNAKVFFKKYKYETGQKIFSIGETTAKTLKDLGIKKVFFPKKPSEENLVNILLQNL